MNVKKYRAATTREALEKIKNDLGEDAFVLETKQVRSKGFFGFRGENQIEVSAVAPEFASTGKNSEKRGATVGRNSGKAVFNSHNILNLTDDSPAAPAASENEPADFETKPERTSFLNALKFRAAAGNKDSERNFGAGDFEDDFEDDFEAELEAALDFGDDLSKTAEKNSRKFRNIDAVEISTEAPKIVHRKKRGEIPAPVQTEFDPGFQADRSRIAHTEKNPAIRSEKDFESTISPLTAAKKVTAEPPVSAAVAAAISKQDIELIRAELREVKHSISAFASRQNVQLFSGEIDFEAFGEIYDSPFYDHYIELTATGLRPETVRRHLAEIIPQVKQGVLKTSRIAEVVLYKILNSTLRFEADPLARDTRSILAVIGATGVGKTTTIAKLAARVALHEGRRVELVTLDTYRIAAVEQLKTYAQIIGAGCHVTRSVFELDAILNRLPEDATILIDTTGKNPHDLADQYEVSDYLKKHSEIRKCLAVQATMHPIDGTAAMKKFEMYGADCLALTKIDETTRPGALVETISQSELPLVYCCNGQRVPEDIHAASSETFIAQILQRNFNPMAKAA